jgi:hypothetical protein
MAGCLLQAGGLFWDEAIVYEPVAKWKDEAKPAFLSGPVIKIATGLESALDALP